MPGQKVPSTELLEDLCSRFILNVPAEEIETFDRLLFLVEQAHWFYEDVSVERDPTLKSLSLKEFTALVFRKVPGLEAYQGFLNDILRTWQQYKASVPVNGAMLLDPSLDKVLLVRGWKHGSGWGFPRGKVAKNEGDLSCAVREVKEETGYDIAGSANEADYVEVTVGGQRSRLYIVPGVPEDTVFAPQVKKEIGALAWHLVAELPATKEEANQVYLSDSGDRHRFFMVWPYIKQLRRWIKNHRKAAAGGQKQKQPTQAAAAAARSGGSKAGGGKAAGSGKAATVKHSASSASLASQHQREVAAPAAAAAPPTAAQEPGRCLTKFAFDQKAIMRQLDAALYAPLELM